MAVALNRIGDVTEVEVFDLTFQSVFALAAKRRSRRLANCVKSALIARRDIEIGFAMMFQTLNDHTQIEIRIHSTRGAAKEWFAQGPNP
jgi:hypothetical protein